MVCAFLTGLLALSGWNPAAGQAIRYEAESANLASATTASTHAGYSGAGYVTGLTSEWSRITFERSYNELTPVKLDIRYANGSGSPITNLSVWQGSNTKIQDLSLPPTGAWSTWATATVTFNVPAGYQGIVIKSGANVSVSANLDYFDLTPNPPPTAPGAFSQSAPAGGATGVSTTPAFAWGASSNAASYALVVSTSSTFTNPVINQSGLTGTSYTPGTALAASTLYYWRVTAVNTAGSAIATNAGISFTTGVAAPPPSSQPGVIREYWPNVTGTGVAALTGHANYPNSPASTSVLTSFDALKDVGDDYGQRVKGYLKPLASGSYQFSIASDDDSELWLSTNNQPANKVKIASVSGWTNYLQYDKYGTQTSAAITLTAGQYYYIEALHKEISGGDHLTVAWQGPGIAHQIITGTYLVTAPPAPLPAPGAFSQTAPANAATGVSLTPAFSWGASSSAESYTLVVSTSPAYASPVINQSGITTTSYTLGGGLVGNTTYYWKVTAVNATTATVAANAGASFTTLTPPAPGTFSQTAPASAATGVSRTAAFSWGAASNASSYALVVSTSSTYASPVINVSGLTATSYSHSASLAGNTTYYWRVTATNATGSKVASNAGISFTTSATTGTYYYVATSGQDAAGRGAPGSPFRTIAYAAKQVPAGQNNTIYVNAGTYSETEAIVLPVGVNLEGAGEASVTITAAGPVPAPGIDQSSGDWKLWWDGSLIQLVSASYKNDVALKYGSPEEMTAAANGNQTLSGFTVDGNNKQIKAGVWVQNRNNVTMHHVTIKNCQQRGAVFGRSDMWWYIPLPEGKWMTNTTIYNCTFLNNGAQLGSESLGNLCLAGLDGADIYNLTINDNVGYGIKFIFVGHYRNVKIHDCTITVNENDAAWGEKISIELWNLSYGNEVYNITCNTWHSYVNHGDITAYEPTGTNTDNLKIYGVQMVDQDGSSGKEAIEAALSGVEIHSCYIQDKGFGIAIWNGQGQTLKKNFIIRNNIIANVLRTPAFGFGKSAGVFVPDAAQNVKIYNNVFDRMGNGLNLDGVTGADVRNNVFLNTEGADVENGSSITFNNNLKYHTNAQKNAWTLTGGPALGTGNVIGAPGFQNTGSRWTTYYKPASSGSFSVDKGANVGLPFVGAAPDLGRWEFGSVGGRTVAEPGLSGEPAAGTLDAYPNPTRGIIHLVVSPDLKITGIEVLNTRGVVVFTGSPAKLTRRVIDISAQTADLYLLKVQHERGIITRKVLLVK